MLHIGPIPLPSPFCQAGLAGYSDRAMRLVARRRGCPYAVTEALLDIIMANGGHGLRKSIDINDEDHPIAGQIIGSEPQVMATAAKLLCDAGYDVIDLNFACPVKKIKNKARGGHMLRDTTRAISILRAVRQTLGDNATLTVSLRRAFDDSAESADAFEQVWQAVWHHGCSAARVHARTVEQKYNGPSRWEFLRQLKAKNPTRTILGSGDLFTAQDAVRMLRETGVDCAWIARGAIGNPWIFNHARLLLAGQQHVDPPSIHEQRDALREHFHLAMELHGESLAGRRMRKMGIKYARLHPAAPDVKKAFIEVSSQRQWENVLSQYYSTDGPGLWPAAEAVDEVNPSCEIA